MKSFFEGAGMPHLSHPDTAPQPLVPVYTPAQAEPSAFRPIEREVVPVVPSEARIAVYDSLTASPRVELVQAPDAGSFIETLAARVFGLAKEAGGSVPFMVIREIVENFVHAGFAEPVVTVMDDGYTIRFSDQGPGIPDKDRAFSPGFSTATREMKRVIKGVGSGLPIVKECLGFSEGSIEVEDNLGRGTVVTVRVRRAPEPAPAVVPQDTPRTSAELSTRQKRVLSLVVELGSVGPTVVAKELGVGLSTAYRDLASLEDLGLLMADESGKRVLTQTGVGSLDRLLGF